MGEFGSDMAEDRSKKDPLAEHPLVKKLIKDPSHPTDTVVLVGYPGRSTSDNVIRLYDGLDFKSYKEIDKKDILHADHIPKEVMAEGGTIVWVSKDSQVTYTRVDTSKIAARFLEGEITRTYMAREVEPMFRAAAVPRQPSVDVDCGPRISEMFLCPTQGLECLPTPQNMCRTPQLTCPSDRCPTPIEPCGPPTPRGMCPTPRGGCPSPVGFCGPTPRRMCPTIREAECPPTTRCFCAPTPEVWCPSIRFCAPTPRGICPVETPECP
jgi:hypothetical protein